VSKSGKKIAPDHDIKDDEHEYLMRLKNSKNKKYRFVNIL
jgi:hypothetical protein